MGLLYLKLDKKDRSATGVGITKNSSTIYIQYGPRVEGTPFVVSWYILDQAAWF